MRMRTWTLLALLLALAAMTACSGSPLARVETPTPRPVKTLRPTFTPASAQQGVVIPATSTRRPTMTPTATTPATATIPPTAEVTTPTAQPAAAESATLTVVNATLNVRGGPGTTYPVIGQVRQGQQFEITGKNAQGDWWQFSYDGQPGWVLGTMVNVNEAAANVQVAVNIPTAPTARPQPTAGPRPPAQPTAPPAPPAPTYRYAAAGSEWRPGSNDRVTVRCRVNVNSGTMRGSAGIIQVRGPVTSAPTAFSEIIDIANTGMDTAMQYMYNSNCKVELAPFVAGTYTAVLLDGGGNQVSDPINFTADGDMREFIVTWKAR